MFDIALIGVVVMGSLEFGYTVTGLVFALAGSS